MAKNLAQERLWLNKAQCESAEAAYYERLAGGCGGGGEKAAPPAPASSSSPSALPAVGSIATEIAKARQHIKNSLDCVDNLASVAGGTNAELVNQLNALQLENSDLKKVTSDLHELVHRLELRVSALEGPTPAPSSSSAAAAAASAAAAAAAAAEQPTTKTEPPPSKPQPMEQDADDDEDIDLFGDDDDDDEEDAEAAKVREERLAAYAAKKAKKPTVIAKTSVLLDVKPWADDTDMAAMLKAVKSIEKDGLLWGASKLVPVGYGISKLSVLCVVEDAKVSIEELQEQIAEFDDFVQSCDVATMQKI